MCNSTIHFYLIKKCIQTQWSFYSKYYLSNLFFYLSKYYLNSIFNIYI